MTSKRYHFKTGKEMVCCMFVSSESLRSVKLQFTLSSTVLGHQQRMTALFLFLRCIHVPKFIHCLFLPFFLFTMYTSMYFNFFYIFIVTFLTPSNFDFKIFFKFPFLWLCILYMLIFTQGLELENDWWLDETSFIFSGRFYH